MMTNTTELKNNQEKIMETTAKSTDTYKMYLHSENCIMAGTRVSDHTLEEHDGDPDENPDWVIVQGSLDGLRIALDWYRRKNESATGTYYYGRCAESIEHFIEYITR